MNHNASLAAVQSETPAFDFTFITYNPDIPTVPEGNFEPSYLSQEFGATVEPPNPVAAGLFDSIPADSRTADALTKLGLVGLSDSATRDIAQRLQQVYVVDTGCGQHTFSRKDGFLNMRRYSGPATMGIGGKVVMLTHIGDFALASIVNGKEVRSIFHDAVYSPAAGVNLISVS